ncbi:ATP-dependent DNA helicase PcrA [subsurface metagenome]
MNVVDFDDLIVLPVKLFDSFPDALSYYQNKFQYIMVDEFQDTSGRQYELIRHLAVEHRNICVVGDDDQSIYSWRGASFENITKFERDFPERLEIKLEQNYRSMRNILIAANCLIANNKKRKRKELWTKGGDGDHIQIFFPEDEHREADFIADHIHSLAIKQRIPLNQFGVLVRTNNLMRILEEAFRRENLPYRVSGGLSFYQRKEVKDLIAYLRVLANPDDNTNLLRIINTPRRGIGKKALEFIIETAEKNSCSNFSAIALIAENDQPAINEKMLESIVSFYNLIEQYRTSILSGRKMAPILQSLVDSIEYRAFLFQEYQKPATARLKYEYNVLGLIESLDYYENNPDNLAPGLYNYLNMITLANQEDSTEAIDQDKINLMTIHASKGLEFEVVFIAAVEKDIIPHIRSQESGEMNIEEERRLFYVALTRAMSKLYISAAATRKKHGKLIETEPSPFITELPEELLEIRWVITRVLPEPAPARIKIGLLRVVTASYCCLLRTVEKSFVIYYPFISERYLALLCPEQKSWQR